MTRTGPAACPTADRLARLLADDGPGDVDLDAHVERCGRCQAALEGMARGDGLGGPNGEPDSGEERLVGRLKGCPPAGWAGPGPAPARIGFHPVWAAPAPAPVAGRPRVGGYEVLGELGRGGMGVVYKARDIRLGRVVALKVLPTGTADGPGAAARFRREAEAAARLHHPGIVAVHGVGESDGWPHLVLEYVEGGTLAGRLDGSPLPAQAAAGLVEQLARAVAYAHGRGVVHRDIKPANVLLAADGSPKLGDFGLARVADAPDGPTRDGALLGTPSYMAPEQAAAGGAAPAGPAADVYGLGAVLYELLTGRPPFRAETPLETLLQVVHLDPVPPSRLRPSVHRDIETVCLKCLEKNPARRYPSATELAADLGRFRAGEPVLARPVSRRRRAASWVRRNPAPAVLLAVGFLLPCLVAAAGWWQWRLAEAQATAEGRAKEAEGRERAAAEGRAADLTVDRNLDLCESGAVAHGLLGLAHTLTRIPADNPGLVRLARLNLSSWRNRVVVQRFILPQPDAVLAVAYRPDGRAAAFGLADGTARVWDVEAGEPLGPPLAHGGPVRHVAFDPAGDVVLTGGDDGAARLWHAATGQQVGSPLRHGGPVRAVAFAPDGRFAVTAGVDGTARVWEVPSGRPCGEPVRHPGPLDALAISPDGRRVVTAGEGGALLWNLTEVDPVIPLTRGRNVLAVAFSPDGRRAATADDGGEAVIWDVAAGTPVGPPLQHAVPLRTVAFMADGRALVTGGGFPGTAPGEVRVWDVAAGRPLGPTLPHPRFVHTTAVHPNGKHVLAAGSDWRAALWLAADDRPTYVPVVHTGAVTAAAFSPDGRGFLTASTPQGRGNRAEVRVFRFPADPRPGPDLPHPAAVTAVAARPDGRMVATGCADGRVRLWSWPDGRLAGGPLPMTDGFAVRALAFDPTGDELAAGDEKGLARRWESHTGRPVGEPITCERAVRSLAYSPDGGRLAVGGLFPVARVLDLRTGAVAHYPHDADAAGVAFDPAGAVLATACSDTYVHLWDAARRRPAGPPLPFGLTARIVAFLPDGRGVVCGGAGREVRVWDAATGSNAVPPLLLPDAVAALAVSPTGDMIATASLDGSGFLWDIGTGKRVGPALLQGVSAVAFSPDGRTLFAGGPRGVVRPWALPAPVPGTPDQVMRWVETNTGYEMLADGTLRPLPEDVAAARSRAMADDGRPIP